MSRLFRLAGAARHDPAVEAWFTTGADEMRNLVQPWFERMRACGPDVRALLHDGQPTVCVADAAFAYVDAFTSHANVGFFHGAALEDPAGLLEGAGRNMRHVKLRWNRPVAAAALDSLIAAAYHDVRARLASAP